MTHPLTPREKVELKPCPFCGGDAVAGSNFDNDHYVMCGADCDKCGGMVGYMKTETAAIENWNRRTALASGSGDHAELAAISSAIGTVRFMDPPDGGDVPLSEQVRRMASALTEAERKLAEAVEWRPIETAPRDGRYILAVMTGADGRWEHLNGRAFVIRNRSLSADDYDLGWDVYPGFGGVSDRWFSGWLPLPPAPGAEDE